MPIIRNNVPTLFGTAGEDILFDYGNIGTTTITGLGGNDVIYGDMPDSPLVNQSGTDFFSPRSINNDFSLLENPDVENSTSVPYATIIETAVAGETHWFSVYLDAGETLTLDVDYGDDHSTDVDTFLRLYRGFTLVASNDDNPNPDFNGSDTGVPPQLDAYLSYTATVSGTYTFQVSNDGGNFAAGDDYILYASNTGATENVGADTSPDEIYGGSGRDTAHGMVGDDTVYGGTGNDVLTGGSGDDSVYGGDDDDTIDGGLGYDILEGDGGHDVIRGDSGKDTMTGGEGRDEMHGGSGRDVMNGSTWNDSLFGNGGADRMYGGVGKDTVNGGGGDDMLRGNEGRDRMIGGDGDDVLHGGTGEDFQFGRDGNDILNGNEDDDTMNGQADNDSAYGGGGNDVITGGGGEDFIRGGSGDDRMNGGVGNDTLEGGSGMDEFVFKDFISTDRDTILDFEDGQDVLLFKPAALTFHELNNGVMVQGANGYELFIYGWDFDDIDTSDYAFI